MPGYDVKTCNCSTRMPADDVTSCPPAVARFSEHDKSLDTARCGSLRDTPTVL